MIIVTFSDIIILCDAGEHSWGAEGSETGVRRCPMCLTAGPVVRVCCGIEPAFYVDAGPPTYAFNPCGHMASERTVKSVYITHNVLDMSGQLGWYATTINIHIEYLVNGQSHPELGNN